MNRQNWQWFLQTCLVYQSSAVVLSSLCVGTTTSDLVFVGKSNLDFSVMDFEAEPSNFSRKRITGHYGTVSVVTWSNKVDQMLGLELYWRTISFV